MRHQVAQRLLLALDSTAENAKQAKGPAFAIGRTSRTAKMEYNPFFRKIYENVDYVPFCQIYGIESRKPFVRRRI